mmetsp:Transcript_5022/g.5434  ORF Transcript_5022/g.5434 Transcript_5022/m.5434 type:complete len:223 (-) Transcript_5022:39-707(-)
MQRPKGIKKSGKHESRQRRNFDDIDNADNNEENKVEHGEEESPDTRERKNSGDQSGHRILPHDLDRPHSNRDRRSPQQEVPKFQNPLITPQTNHDHIALEMKEEEKVGEKQNGAQQGTKPGTKPQQRVITKRGTRRMSTLIAPPKPQRNPIVKFLCIFFCCPLWLMCFIAHKIRQKYEKEDDINVPNTEGDKVELWSTCLIGCALCTCGASYCIVGILKSDS